MAKKLEVGAAILAEYVAQGAQNKITIVNAYSGDVLVGDYPIELGFGLYIELRFKDSMPAAIVFELLLNGDLLLRGTASSAAVSGEVATVVVPHFVFKVEKDSQLELYVSVEGYTRVRAMKKRLAKGDLSTALRQPS